MSGLTTEQIVGQIGRIVAPIAALLMFFLLPHDEALTDTARATAAIATLMAILWLTEGLPLAATALIPILLLPACDVMSVSQTTAQYGHRFIFLFMGGFMVALAMERWNLHRRIALLTVAAVGTQPVYIIAGFMLATGLLSMWLSNTATTLMMLPIGMSVVELVSANSAKESEARDFGTCLMLAIAYSASIGGMGTIIGTPTNVFVASFAHDDLGVDIGFGRWMLLGVPLSLTMLLICWVYLTRFAYPMQLHRVGGGRELIRSEIEKLGPMSRGERIVAVVFTLTAFFWVARKPLASWPLLAEHFPALGRIDDSSVAIAAALILFAIPIERGVFVLDWPTAVKLPWGMLLLFGSGLALAQAFKVTGLSEWIGFQAAPFANLPTIPFVMVVTAIVLLLTELTSNTATAVAFFPILASVAAGLDMDPLMVLLPAGLAASGAFMLPVATPPNAIVFGSGQVTIGQMVRAGVWLNLIGLVTITLLSSLAFWLGIL